ncbi:hypothetical protein INQ23_24370, partial [Escherichia coli]|nr:hypothetical protein [Escherichia coli]
GGVETGFIAAHADRLATLPGLSPDLDYKIRLWLADASPETKGPAGFRLNAPPMLSRRVFVNGVQHQLDGADGLDQLLALAPAAPMASQFEIMGIHREGADAVIFSEGLASHITLAIRGSGAATTSDGAILAPMPGRVTA